MLKSSLSILVLELLISITQLTYAQDSLGVARDTDPTKPTAFSLRNEFTNINETSWSNAFILRFDKLAIKRFAIPKRSEGILARIDIPIVSTSTPVESKTGLGDVYLQALVAPRIQGNFFIAGGTGIAIPTATSQSLGSGKWIAAPVIAPIFLFPKKGLAYIKFQDYISFAGNADRQDVHYFSISPVYLRRIKKRFWTVVDTEMKTNWLDHGHTWFKSGLLAGTMLSPRIGIWVQGEVPYGQYRQADWVLKASLFVTKF